MTRTPPQRRGRGGAGFATGAHRSHFSDYRASPHAKACGLQVNSDLSI